MKKKLIGLVILIALGVGVFFGYRQYRIATFVPPEPAVDEEGRILSSSENFYRMKPPFKSKEDWIRENYFPNPKRQK